jgi:acetyl-CoA decarbonylase/synthase complex subunit gamma
MGLTGIQIFKMLPRTNCKECGQPTCLAFAMALAAGKAELEKCPYVSDDAKAVLAEASAPPIRPVKIGNAERGFTIGGETCMFRHEKTFVNKPGLAIYVSDAMPDGEIDQKIENFMKYRYERVGVLLKADMFAVKSESGDADKFKALVSKINEKTDATFTLMSDNKDVLAAGIEALGDNKPLIYTATKDNWEEMAELAKSTGCPLAVRAENLDEAAELTQEIQKAGVKDMVLDTSSRTLRRAFEDQIFIRRLALQKKFRPLGFSTIAFPNEMTDDPFKEAVIASMFIAKYAGIIVLSEAEAHNLFPLLVARLNIYTDPQRPMMMEEGIYEINDPDENSPVLITTNFSLTYFVAGGEIEASKVPSWLLIMDTEGLSVLTAWAAGKFVGDAMGIFIKKSGIADKIKHRKVVIPGYVAVVSGDLEEELGEGWEVMIGPREAAHLPAYLKLWKAD